MSSSCLDGPATSADKPVDKQCVVVQFKPKHAQRRRAGAEQQGALIWPHWQIWPDENDAACFAALGQ